MIERIVKTFYFIGNLFLGPFIALWQALSSKTSDPFKKLYITEAIFGMVGLLFSLVSLAPGFFSIAPGGGGIALGIGFLVTINLVCRFIGAWIGRALANPTRAAKGRGGIQSSISGSVGYGSLQSYDSSAPIGSAAKEHVEAPSRFDQALEYALYGVNYPSSAIKKTSEFWQKAYRGVTGSWVWKNILTPLLIAGLFLMVGLALLASSLLVSPGTFIITGALTNPSFVISLATIGVAVLSQLMMHWLKRSLPDSENNQALLAIATGKKVATEWQATKSATLNQEQRWAPALIAAVYAVAKLQKQQQADYRVLFDQNQWASAKPKPIAIDMQGFMGCQTDQQRWQWIKARKNAIQTLFTGLYQFQIDVDGRPPLSSKYKWLLGALIAGLAIGSLLILGRILQGSISIVAMSWAMPLAAALGFSSWIASRYLLSRTSGGVYSQWAVFFGMALFTIVALSFGPFIGSLARTISILALVAALALSIAKANQHASLKPLVRKNAMENPDASSRINYDRAQGALTFIKGVVVLGAFFVMILSVAAMFNLSHFGVLSGLMDKVYELLVQKMHMDAYTIGAQWFGAFCLGFFIIAGLIAFTLIEDMLQLSARSVEELETQQQSKGKIVLGLIGKLTFTIGVIAFLYGLAGSGAFLTGNTSLFLPFTVLLAFMPLLSGNTNLPWPKFNNAFNIILGLKPFHETGEWGREKAWFYTLLEAVIWIILFIPAMTVPVSSYSYIIFSGAAGVAVLSRLITLWKSGLPTFQTRAEFQQETAAENAAFMDLKGPQSPTNLNDVAERDPLTAELNPSNRESKKRDVSGGKTRASSQQQESAVIAALDFGAMEDSGLVRSFSLNMRASTVAAKSNAAGADSGMASTARPSASTHGNGQVSTQAAAIVKPESKTASTDAGKTRTPVQQQKPATVGASGSKARADLKAGKPLSIALPASTSVAKSNAAGADSGMASTARPSASTHGNGQVSTQAAAAVKPESKTASTDAGKTRTPVQQQKPATADAADFDIDQENGLSDDGIEKSAKLMDFSSPPQQPSLVAKSAHTVTLALASPQSASRPESKAIAVDSSLDKALAPVSAFSLSGSLAPTSPSAFFKPASTHSAPATPFVEREQDKFFAAGSAGSASTTVTDVKKALHSPVAAKLKQLLEELKQKILKEKGNTSPHPLDRACAFIAEMPLTRAGFAKDNCSGIQRWSKAIVDTLYQEMQTKHKECTFDRGRAAVNELTLQKVMECLKSTSELADMLELVSERVRERNFHAAGLADKAFDELIGINIFARTGAGIDTHSYSAGM